MEVMQQIQQVNILLAYSMDIHLFYILTYYNRHTLLKLFNIFIVVLFRLRFLLCANMRYVCVQPDYYTKRIIYFL